MWAAIAVIAAIAGGPLGICLAISSVVMANIKLNKVDAEYAKKGETPPGYRLIEKWLDGRKARGQAPAGAKPAKYGMWRYFWQRWQAMWELAATEHQAQHEQQLTARQQPRTSGQPAPAKAKQSLKERWEWLLNKAVNPVGEKPAAEPAPVAAPARPEPAPEARTACEDCGQTLIQRGGAWVHPSSAGCPEARPAPMGNNHEQVYGEVFYWICPHIGCPGRAEDLPSAEAAHAELIRHLDVQHDGVGRDNPVTVKRPDNSGAERAAEDEEALGETPTTEGEPMPATATQSGEVTGIPSAVHYLRQVAAVLRSHAGDETLRTSIANMNIGSGDINRIDFAMTGSRDAAELYENAASTIESHNAAVKEAYASAPDAADKHAHTAS